MVKVKAVYQLTFPDGKIYIGSTEDLLIRLRNHKSNIKRRCYAWYKQVTCTWDDVAISYIQVPEDDLLCTEYMCINMTDTDLLYNKLCV